MRKAQRKAVPKKKKQQARKKRRAVPRHHVRPETFFELASAMLLGYVLEAGFIPYPLGVPGCTCICHTFGQVTPLGAPLCPPDCPTRGSRFDGCHACDCPSGEHHKHHLTKGERKEAAS